MKDLIEIDYFYILDIAWSILFMLLLMMYVNTKKKEYEHLDYFQYYKTNIYVKIVLSLVYAFYYTSIVQGGDTLAYWDGAIKLNHLFWKDTSMYFAEIFKTPDLNTMYFQHYDAGTGFPPLWIYKEPESWFISKVLSFFTFFTFNSYLVTTLVLAYISSRASWKLFELVHSFQLNTNKHIAYAVVLIPSVSFWCSGINKDMIVLYCSIMLIYNAFQILSLDKETKLKNFLWIAFYVFLLYHIRDFMISTIAVALIFTYSARLANKYRAQPFMFYSIRILSIVVGVLFFAYQGDGITNSEKLEEAAVIQKDFATNETYEGSRYDLGVTDFSASGMLKAFPVAVIAGFYRPFLWESLKVTLIFNGLEGLFFLYLTYVFFRRGVFSKMNLIRKHEFFIFAFFFAVLMAYMAGVTSGLLGVLVRFKAPLIPFLMLLLTIDVKLKETNNVQIMDIKSKKEEVS
jgi:hypothetical protein